MNEEQLGVLILDKNNWLREGEFGPGDACGGLVDESQPTTVGYGESNTADSNYGWGFNNGNGYQTIFDYHKDIIYGDKWILDMFYFASVRPGLRCFILVKNTIHTHHMLREVSSKYDVIYKDGMYRFKNNSLIMAINFEHNPHRVRGIRGDIVFADYLLPNHYDLESSVLHITNSKWSLGVFKFFVL